MLSENTQMLLKGKYYCTADLQMDWFGFNRSSKSFLNLNVNFDEAKPVKMEVICTFIFLSV